MLFGLFTTKNERIEQLENEVYDLTRSFGEECLSNHSLREALAEALAERDGARLALTSYENQLCATKARLAQLTTRGPGGRFVKVATNGSCHM